MLMKCHVGALLTLFLLSACVSVPSDVLDPRRLNGSDELDGSTVTVRGYLVGSRCLYQSRERFELFRAALYSGHFDPAVYRDDAISLLDLPPDGLRGDTENYVTVRGIFTREYLDGTVLDLGACGRSALRLVASAPPAAP